MGRTPDCPAGAPLLASSSAESRRQRRRQASDDARDRGRRSTLPNRDVEGVRLAYREEGEGEPVVFVHGSSSDLRSWEQQVPVIAGSHRAIAYSRRYARPNEDIEPGADDQMLPHVDDLIALVRALDAAPAHLVGHSWGAFICLLTAIRQPSWCAAWCSPSLPCCRSS